LRLDSEAEERRKLTLLLTHQQELAVKSVVINEKIEERSENQLWKKVFKNR
jgi:hypothetical protein